MEEGGFADIRKTNDAALKTCQKTMFRRGRGVEGTFKLLPGRPRRSFFSCAAFLGGIFFFRRGWDVEKLGFLRGSGRLTARRRMNSLSTDRRVKKIFDVAIEISRKKVERDATKGNVYKEMNTLNAVDSSGGSSMHMLMSRRQN